jgi:hypothetical protein
MLIIPGYLLYALLGAGAGMLTGNHQQAEGGIWLYWVPWVRAILALGLFRVTTRFAVIDCSYALSINRAYRYTAAHDDVRSSHMATCAVLLVLTVLLVTWFIARIFSHNDANVWTDSTTSPNLARFAWNLNEGKEMKNIWVIAVREFQQRAVDLSLAVSSQFSSLFFSHLSLL